MSISSEAELAARRSAWNAQADELQLGHACGNTPRRSGPADKGAVTHPGGKAETHVYAEL